ncbi:MAG: wax ester/triacylglycerol synthase family O-acyltransferase [Candidatus Binataceae bacterium]
MADEQATFKLKHRLTTLDSAFLYAETAENPLHIGSLAIFEGHVPFDQLVDWIRDRIHLLPRYRQRLATVPFNLAHPTVEDDPDFRVENHVKRFVLRPSLSEEEMVQVALRAYHPMLDRSRPLWGMLLFENWAGGNTCIVSKTHHALIDGVSGVELIKHMYEFHPDAPPPEPPAVEWKPPLLPNPLERLVDAAHDVVAAQIDSAFEVARSLARNPRTAARRVGETIEGLRQMSRLATGRIAATPWNAMPATSARSLAWIRNSFGEYRAIRRAFGGTVNHVVLAVLTEGAARYLKHHGYPTDRPLRVGCPVNVRRAEEIDDLGNRVSMMFPELPSEPMDVVERLNRVREEMERIKGSAHALERLNSLTELAPASLLAMLGRAGTLGFGAGAALARIADWRPSPQGLLMPPFGINFIATNVPGVQVPQYLCGHRCLDQIGLLPLGGNLGYGVAILSYNGNLYLGMMAEPRMIPDLELMKSYVSEAFEELKRAVQTKTMTPLPVACIEIAPPSVRSAARLAAQSTRPAQPPHP